MIPRIRVSLLAIFATLAIGAVSAGAAQAGEFTAEKYPATITGTQLTDHVFQFNMWSITCKKATFDGELAAASSELTLDAEYGECKTNNGKAAIVTMTSCDYRFSAAETLGEDKVDGSLGIHCDEAGDGIDFEVPFNGCKVKVPEQAGLHTLVFTDNTGARDFDVDIGVAEMEYIQNANCPGGALAAANGEYTGKSTMQAKFEGAVIGTTVD